MAGFFLDHNVIRSLASELRRRGHAIMAAQEAHLDRAGDGEILLFAGREGLIIVTGDSDFAELHRGGRIHHAGILLIRPLPLGRRERARAMADAIDQLLASDPPLVQRLYRHTPLGWIPE